MKRIGYRVFAILYNLYRLFGRKPNRVFCIMTHDSGKDSSVGSVIQYLMEKEKKYEYYYLRKEEKKNIGKGFSKVKEQLTFLLIKPYYMATSSYIFMDNCFLPMAYMDIPKEIKVVQLWHGTGTIKKFGQDANVGKLKELERKCNEKITHLIANSSYIKGIYEHSFGIAKDKIYVLGIPRTDTLFQQERQNKQINEFYERYPQLKEKKIILYAPTFRDEEVGKGKLHLDLDLIEKKLPTNYVLLLKLHPFVADDFIKTREYYNRNGEICIYNVSEYKDVNPLLLVSHTLVTDYSSVIFEYCILEKPMIFYAYDLERFSENGRGFYEDYQSYVPGPVVKSTKELLEVIEEEAFNIEEIIEFKNQSFAYLDGKSAERFYQTIMK